MKKILKKLLPFIMVSGFAFAYGTLCLLLSVLYSFPKSLLLCQLTLLPFLCYGGARVCKAGKFRYCLNLLGGLFVTPLCYFMICLGMAGVYLLSGKLCGFAYLDRKLCALLLCISVGITLSVVLIGLCNARRIRTVRYTVKLPVKKACKAVFFSDLHLGAFCSLCHVQKVVDTIQKEAPELILFGGDLWDMDLTSQKKCDRYAEMLASLGGILGCEGNHDLFTREDKQKNAFLEKANICIPGDTPVTHPQTQLKIYARKSCRSARAALLPTVDILLDHEPKMAEQAISFGIPLVLCGHTHRGQTFPGNILRSLSTPYFYGLHKKAKSTVITTAGCGSTGLALRFGTTGEIVSIQIEPM